MTKRLYIFSIIGLLLIVCIVFLTRDKASKTIIASKTTSVIGKTYTSIIPPTLDTVQDTIPTLTLLSPIITLGPSPTITVKPLPTPGIKTIKPEITKVCPKQPELPLSQLGLNSIYRLLVEPYDHVPGFPWNTDALVISGVEPWLHSVPNTIMKDNMKLVYAKPSPSGQWLILDYQPEGKNEQATWLSTWDGKRQWKVITTRVTQTRFWNTDEELIVIGLTDDEAAYESIQRWQDYAPRLRINPFSNEITSLSTYKGNNSIYQEYFTNGKYSYGIYFTGLDPFESIVLYNYDNNNSIPIFNWMMGQGGVNYHTAGVYRRKNGLFFARVQKTYGFDIVLDLDLEKISQSNSYDEIMTAIQLTNDNYEQLDWFAYAESTAGEFPVFGNAQTRDNSFFYMFDYNKMILKDYCFESIPLWAEISPDERFVALNIPEDPSNGFPSYYIKEAMVLDLQTGYYAKIHGVKIIGWGIEVPTNP